MSDKEWSDKVATLVADALVEAGILSKQDFEKTIEIISEEVNVRLCLDDYPQTIQKTTNNTE